LSGGRGGDFADLTGASNDRSGQPRSFLSSEENYQYIKSLHEKNLIVPVSGDFAGPKAIRAIAAYLKEHRGTVRAFYVSNVEQYLFGDSKDGLFYANVATLPIDSTSVFIRPYSLRRGLAERRRSRCADRQLPDRRDRRSRLALRSDADLRGASRVSCGAHPRKERSD
jgi:hypothetical protein